MDASRRKLDDCKLRAKNMTSGTSFSSELPDEAVSALSECLSMVLDTRSVY